MAPQLALRLLNAGLTAQGLGFLRIDALRESKLLEQGPILPERKLGSFLLLCMETHTPNS